MELLLTSSLNLQSNVTTLVMEIFVVELTMGRRYGQSLSVLVTSTRMVPCFEKGLAGPLLRCLLW